MRTMHEEAAGLDRSKAFEARLDPILRLHSAKCERVGSLPSSRKRKHRPDCRLVRRIAEMDGDRPLPGAGDLGRGDCFQRVEARRNAIDDRPRRGLIGDKPRHHAGRRGRVGAH
jgi:hypothetical protein